MEVHAHDHVKGLFDKLVADGYAGRVTVRLRGGAELSGSIGPTGNHSVVLKALAGRDFYDAYVRYESITCVEVKARS